jgi:acetyltransferase-like isoleucine patch superfamily enzyme
MTRLKFVVRVLKQGLQVFAACFPRPFNTFLLRIASAKIGKNVTIHPGVVILADTIEIGNEVKIRFGTMINSRRVRVGDKTLVGYFVHVKGASDFLVGAACVIGPRVLINCDCPVELEHYSGVGPSCTLFTHGSFLPVTEGYRTTFGPIVIKEKAWVTMGSILGPGVTVGEGTNVMPGTVLMEPVGRHRLVSGNPARLVNIPLWRKKNIDLVSVGKGILDHYEKYCSENGVSTRRNPEGNLVIRRQMRERSVAIDGEGDIVLLTRTGVRTGGMYFNIADLATDNSNDGVKVHLERFMRLYYGMTFL